MWEWLEHFGMKVSIILISHSDAYVVIDTCHNLRSVVNHLKTVKLRARFFLELILELLKELVFIR
jgi:hypothetical protein